MFTLPSSAGLLTEAIATVDRTVAARQERDLGVLTALGANRGIHLSRAAIVTTTTGSTSSRAAGGAAAGFVSESLLREILLLACFECEICSTLYTSKCLILKSHR